MPCCPDVPQLSSSYRPGDTVDSDQAVIVVLVHGKFDGSVFSHPRGVTVPGGDEMLASFDATTGQVEDFTLLDTARQAGARSAGAGPRKQSPSGLVIWSA